MKLISSPLRYPGSKKRLVRYIHKVLDFNDFSPSVIVEPFVGGGSVFLNFLAKEPTNKAVIADKDKLVYSFWKTLFFHPTHLVNFVKKTPINLKTFIRFKKIAIQSEKYCEKTLAEACLFLNRTSFSGILNDKAGPLGGLKQSSEYKLGCRFIRNTLVDQILKISTFRNRVTVLHTDWENTLSYAKENLKPHNYFIYLDPPFYNKANKLYREFFKTDADHKGLSDFLKSADVEWVLSYDRANYIRTLYKPYIHRSLSWAYSINSPARRITREFFITSKGLKKPPLRYLRHEIYIPDSVPKPAKGCS